MLSLAVFWAVADVQPSYLLGSLRLPPLANAKDQPQGAINPSKKMENVIHGHVDQLL
jgi:hypothetical protein